MLFGRQLGCHVALSIFQFHLQIAELPPASRRKIKSRLQAMEIPTGVSFRSPFALLLSYIAVNSLEKLCLFNNIYINKQKAA